MKRILMKTRFGRNIATATLVCGVFLVASLLLVADDPQEFSPWSEAVNVGPPINMPAPYGDGCPFISKSGLDLYFRSNRPGGYGGFDIYVSHRDSVDDPWETPINLGPEINTAFTELCSFVSIDGHWLYFVSDRPGTCGASDLWVSRRRDKRNDLGWETPKNLGCMVNSAAGEVGPVLFEDETTGQAILYFTSNRPGGSGLLDIYASTMVSDDHETFGPPSPVVELNTAYNDAHAFVRRKDGLELIFFSDRPGGLGWWDLWASTRSSTSAPWSAPVNLGPLVNSSVGDEARPSLSWDGTTLYFWSNREWATKRMDVYQCTRTKLRGVD